MYPVVHHFNADQFHRRVNPHRPHPSSSGVFAAAPYSSQHHHQHRSRGRSRTARDHSNARARRLPSGSSISSYGNANPTPSPLPLSMENLSAHNKRRHSHRGTLPSHYHQQGNNDGAHNNNIYSVVHNSNPRYNYQEGDPENGILRAESRASSLSRSARSRSRSRSRSHSTLGRRVSFADDDDDDRFDDQAYYKRHDSHHRSRSRRSKRFQKSMEMDDTMSVRSSGSFKIYDDRSPSPSPPPTLASARHHAKHRSFHVSADYGVDDDRTGMAGHRKRKGRSRRGALDDGFGGAPVSEDTGMGMSSSGMANGSGSSSRHRRRKSMTGGNSFHSSTANTSGDHFQHQFGTDLSSLGGSGGGSSNASGKMKRTGSSRRKDTHRDSMDALADTDKTDRERKRKHRASKASRQGR